MNWRAISYDWNQARAFLATVEEGSLSAAARQLGLTQPTLSRQVAALEEALGVLLFDRVGRSLVLTPTGVDLLDHVRAMADAAGRLAVSATGQAQAVEGLVCISASDAMAAYVLPGIVRALRGHAPGIDIEIVATNTLSDLRQREADIAIRHVRPDHPDLIARLVREQTGHLYAARSYLDAHGRPRTMADLARETFVGFGDKAVLVERFNEFGIPITTKSIRYASASGLVAWAMVREGLGIGVMADEVADRSPEVERVLPAMEPFRFPMWLVTHRELHTSRRIRLVFDFLAKGLSK